MKENKNTFLKNKNLKKGFPIFPLLIFLGIIIAGLPLSVLSAYFLVFNQRVYPKVSVCKIALTGKTENETLAIVESFPENKPEKIILTTENKQFPLNLSFLKYDPKTTTKNIFKTGREKFFLANFKKLYSLYTNGFDASISLSFDENVFDQEIASISAVLFIPAVNPEIKVIKENGIKKVVVEKGKNGQEVDVKTLKTIIINKLGCPEKETVISIPLIVNSPRISQEKAILTENRAETLLNKEIILKQDNDSWTVNDEEIISFLSTENGFDQDKISEYAKDFSLTINSEPENATFKFENNLVSVFNPSKEGIELKTSEFIENLNIKLNLLESSLANQEMEIPVNKTPAKISTENVNDLGIKELIGEGTSLFYGSISERIHNLNLASLKLNGILIPPGETFSFNKKLGDVSQDTGFKQAYIIKEGRTVLGDGGGVCQVSTTLFRAALNAGLPIIERRAHAYRVHYYEDDLGPGFDATVFDPSADLKIQNNTSGHILIQSKIDLKKKQLTFDLYGAKDNRKVEISKARVWDKQPPPPDLYQDDPTLPAGTIKQIDWKAWGAKAAFDYKVTRDGETLFEKTFSSIYKPWQAVYLRGTGN